jgi:putative transposase
MARYDLDKRHRQSIRLRGWDYRRIGAYFVTIVAYGRETLFGQVMDGEMVLSAYGRVAATMWQRLPSHFPCVRLDKFVVMPNHVHGIIWLVDNGDGRGEASQTGTWQGKEPSHGERKRYGVVTGGMPHPYKLESGSLGAIVGNFKSVTARRTNRMRRTPGAPVWQRNYHERIVRNERELNAIRQYILDNPANWEEDGENPCWYRG